MKLVVYSTEATLHDPNVVLIWKKTKNIILYIYYMYNNKIWKNQKIVSVTHIVPLLMSIDL